MLMILARLVRSESFWAVAKVRSPHTGPEPGYPRTQQWSQASQRAGRQPRALPNASPAQTEASQSCSGQRLVGRHCANTRRNQPESR